MRGVVTARCPDQEDNTTLPHAKALQPKFAVAFASIFHRDHRVVEDRFQVRKINLVLADIFPSLRLAPGDHAQTVYGFYGSVNQIVDAN